MRHREDDLEPMDGRKTLANTSPQGAKQEAQHNTGVYKEINENLKISVTKYVGMRAIFRGSFYLIPNGKKYVFTRLK